MRKRMKWKVKQRLTKKMKWMRERLTVRYELKAEAKAVGKMVKRRSKTLAIQRAGEVVQGTLSS